MAEEDEAHTWAVVETHKGIEDVFSYRGRLKNEQLEAWKKGELKGALTLEHAYWLEQRHNQVVPYVIGQRGDYRNARGVLHVDASTVSIIIELEGADPGVLEPQPGAPVLTLARSPSTGRRRLEKAPEPPPESTEPPESSEPPAPTERDGDDGKSEEE